MDLHAKCPIDSTGVQKRRVLCQGKVAEVREGRLGLLWRIDGVCYGGWMEFVREGRWGLLGRVDRVCYGG